MRASNNKSTSTHIRFFITFFLGLVTTGCSAGQTLDNTEESNLLSKKVLEATSIYGARIEWCDAQILKYPGVKFDLNRLKSLGATRTESITAVSFISFNNYYECERKERHNFAFLLATLKNLQVELNVATDSIERIQSLAVYPSSKEIKLEIDYLKLSAEKRAYYESVLGTQPFDLMTVLESNELLRP
ncbi:hypothetical protein [Halioxenophilus aromaticivorans]|uniref:Lipoprotein n=1 Tax=Halioxenophilus aromaticivorans TaxID=1306992 RepID=A0AAV3U284_9ALTE